MRLKSLFHKFNINSIYMTTPNKTDILPYEEEEVKEKTMCEKLSSEKRNIFIMMSLYFI